MTPVEHCNALFEHLFGIDADYKIAVQSFEPRVATIHVYTRVPLGYQIKLEDAFLDKLLNDPRAASWQLSVVLHARDQAPTGRTMYTLAELAEESPIGLKYNRNSTDEDRALGDLHFAIR